MIILLHGNDSFRSLQQLHRLTRSFKEKGGAVIVIEAEDFTIDSFRHHLSTQGLFSSDKLIILKDIAAEKTANDHKLILPLLKKMPAATTVIFFERKSLDARTAFSRELKKASRAGEKIYYPEYAPLSSQEKSAWIAKKLSEAGKNIEPQALQLLANSSINSFQTGLEINKLAYSPINPLTKDAIYDLCLLPDTETIFNLTEAIAQKNCRRAFELLNRQLEKGAEPLYLLSMIAREIKILVKIKSAGATEAHNMAETVREHPFVVQKSASAAAGFTMEQLTHLYDQIQKTDYAIKSSRMPSDILLTKLVYEIVRE
jgi:DNA polymerase-3 subunit delta